MDINLIERLLDAELAKTEATYVNGACVQTLKKPVLMAEMLERTLNTNEERELYSGTFEAWPGNVHEYLDSEGLRTALFTLAWDGFGPVSWACGVETINTGGYSYVVCWEELEGHQLFARVTPTGNTEGLRMIAREAISNGTLVSSVPHNIFNDRSELFERDLFREAFADLLDNTGGWACSPTTTTGGSSSQTTCSAASTSSRPCHQSATARRWTPGSTKPRATGPTCPRRLDGSCSMMCSTHATKNAVTDGDLSGESTLGQARSLIVRDQWRSAGRRPVGAKRRRGID